MKEIKFDYIYKIGGELVAEMGHKVWGLNNLEFGDTKEWYLNLLNDKGISIIAKRQYTGLKDKNGVEIYEGDIVCGTFGIPPIFVKSTVEYKDGMFLIKTPKHDPQECSIFDAINCLDIEVIGNIYENPELLEIK